MGALLAQRLLQAPDVLSLASFVTLVLEDLYHEFF